MELVDRPTQSDRRIIRDPTTYDAIKHTFGTDKAAIVPFNSDSNTARALRARFWREGLRLRIVKLGEGRFAAWLEAIIPGHTK